MRVFGQAVRSSAEPGYASEPVDFLAVRDTLAWSLPPVWGLASAGGETPDDLAPEADLREDDGAGAAPARAGSTWRG